MPSNPLNLCHPLLLLPLIFPSIRVSSNESVLHIRWPKYWGFSFSISPSNAYSGLISFRMDWFDLLAVQGTLKSLLQHHSSKASVLGHIRGVETEKMKVSVAQSCLTLCNPMDCSLPGSSVRGILQARILEWDPFSRGSSRPRIRTWVSRIAGRFFPVPVTGKLCRSERHPKIPGLLPSQSNENHGNKKKRLRKFQIKPD